MDMPRLRGGPHGTASGLLEEASGGQESQLLALLKRTLEDMQQTKVEAEKILGG